MQLGPLQTKWLDALKSGKYKKGKTFLRTLNDEYCCLGIAFEVAGVAGVECNFCKYPGCFRYENEICYLSFNIMHIFKLRNERGKIGNSEDSLALMNDRIDTFQPIINMIEDFPELIFTGPA